MYQPANINVPMTSQQSRRKSQASMNNMMTNSNQPAVGNLFNQKGHPMSIDPIQLLNFHHQQGTPDMANMGGYRESDGNMSQSTGGSAPAGGGTTMITMNMINGGNFVQINPIQMYQSNHNPHITNQGLGTYQRLSGMSTGNVSMAGAHHNVGSPEKRTNKKQQLANGM